MDKISDDDLLELFNLVSLDSDAEEEPFVLLSEDNGGQMRAEITALKKQVAELETRLVAVVQGKDAEIGALKARVDQVDQELAAQKKLIQELAAGGEKRAKKPKRETAEEVWTRYNDAQSGVGRVPYYNNHQWMGDNLKSMSLAQQAMQQSIDLLTANVWEQCAPPPQLQRTNFGVFNPNVKMVLQQQIKKQQEQIQRNLQQFLSEHEEFRIDSHQMPPFPFKESPLLKPAAVATATLASVSGGDASSGSATPNDGKKDVGEAMAIDDNKNEPKNLPTTPTWQLKGLEQQDIEKEMALFQPQAAAAAAFLESTYGKDASFGSAAPNNVKKDVDGAMAIDDNKKVPKNLSSSVPGPGSTSQQNGAQQLINLMKGPASQFQKNMLDILKTNPALIAAFVKNSPAPAAVVGVPTFPSVSGLKINRNASTGPATPKEGDVKKDVGEAMAIDDNKNEPKSSVSPAPTLQQEAMEQVNQLMATLKGPTSHEYQRHVLDTIKANPALMKAFIKHNIEQHFKPEKQDAAEDKNNTG